MLISRANSLRAHLVHDSAHAHHVVVEVLQMQVRVGHAGAQELHGVVQDDLPEGVGVGLDR